MPRSRYLQGLPFSGSFHWVAEDGRHAHQGGAMATFCERQYRRTGVPIAYDGVQHWWRHRSLTNAMPAPWRTVTASMPPAGQPVIVMAMNADPGGHYPDDPSLDRRKPDGSWSHWPYASPPTHWSPAPATH